MEVHPWQVVNGKHILLLYQVCVLNDFLQITPYSDL